MKRIILSLCLFIFIRSEAQQINPVPDYVFSNKMSVGRNAVTDTAAYFSIGPRYGAIRGMMPPMVTDTASMSATKRNGLLIFSIQKNKYLYWDSVGSKWAEMAGTAGSAITGSGVAGYMPEFTTSTNLDTTRLYHSAGRFAIGSTSTTNGVFNVYGGQAYFDTSLKVGTQTLLADESKNEVYVNTTSDAGAFALQVSGNQYISGTQSIGTTTAPIGSKRTRYAYEGGIEFERSDGGQTGLITTFNSFDLLINNNNASITMERVSGKIFLNPANTNEVYVNTSTDAGAYALQVSGAIYNTTTITTGAPSGGTAKPFKIGAAATVSPTSPNRTIEIEIDGTTYYLHAKTTND